MNIVQKTFSGVKGLLSGMGLTFKYLVRFDKVITQQYPENRATLVIPPRTRGKVELIKNDNGAGYKCTACGLCVKACPNNSITVEKERDPVTKKMRLTKYEYRFDRCTLCGLCVEACKFDALRMGQQFEVATYSREELIQILNDDYRPPAEQPAAAEPAKAETPSVPAAPAKEPQA